MPKKEVLSQTTNHPNPPDGVHVVITDIATGKVLAETNSRCVIAGIMNEDGEMSRGFWFTHCKFHELAGTIASFFNSMMHACRDADGTKRAVIVGAKAAGLNLRGALLFARRSTVESVPEPEEE